MTFFYESNDLGVHPLLKKNAKEEVKLWGRSQCHVFVATKQKGEVSFAAGSLRVSVRVCIHWFCMLAHISHSETVRQKNKDVVALLSQ